MVTLQNSEKRKNHSNRVKITLRTSENHSKANENHSKKSETHSGKKNKTKQNKKRKLLQKSEFHFWVELTEEQLETKELFFSELPPPKKKTVNVKFTLFGVIFTRFGMIFTRSEINFHSVRVVRTLFTLLKSYCSHFTLFTLSMLREYVLIISGMVGI